MIKQSCWAIVAAFFILMMTVPNALAQSSPMTCEVIDDPTGDHFILIDGAPHFYTTVPNSIEMQRQLRLLPLLEDEIEILSTQVDLCKQSTVEKNEIIRKLEVEVEYQRDLVDITLEPEPADPFVPFMVGMGSGVVVTFIGIIAYRNFTQ